MNRSSEVVGGLPPPPGVTPNFANPESLHVSNVVCQAVCLPTCTLFVLVRLFTKIRVKPPMRPEDYTCFAAWLGLVAYGTLYLISDKYGGGVHMWNVPLAHATRWLQLNNVLEIIYGVLTFVTKTSILLLYSKILTPQRKSATYRLIRLLLFFMFLYYTATTLVKIFECAPRNKIWERKTPGHCVDIAALLYVTGAVNISSDIAILVLPLHVIWQLHMPARRRVGVSAAFLAAIFAPVASALRLVASINGAASPDATYELYPTILWTEAEITTGIICSCVPTIPAFYHHYNPKLASVLSLVDPRSHGKGTGVSSVFSLRDKTPDSRHLQQGGNRLVRADYLELGTLPGEDSSETRKRPVTTIEGGVGVLSQENSGALNRVRASDDLLYMRDGIKKTVCLESHRQQTEDRGLQA